MTNRIRLTMAQAIVKFLDNQYVEFDGKEDKFVDGIIGISTSYNHEDGKVYVSIEDSGSGIPEDKLDRVFESFYKVDPSRTESGFGLGLYICREIITAHGEKIWAENSDDLGGARFIYTLKDYRHKENK